MGRATPRRLRRTEKEWRAILQRFASSGLSSHEFCRRQGLAVSSLQRWRSRCGRAHAAEFVELAMPSTVPAAASRDWVIELELPGGVRLRLRG